MFCTSLVTTDYADNVVYFMKGGVLSTCAGPIYSRVCTDECAKVVGHMVSPILQLGGPLIILSKWYVCHMTYPTIRWIT